MWMDSILFNGTSVLPLAILGFEPLTIRSQVQLPNPQVTSWSMHLSSISYLHGCAYLFKLIATIWMSLCGLQMYFWMQELNKLPSPNQLIPLLWNLPLGKRVEGLSNLEIYYRVNTTRYLILSWCAACWDLLAYFRLLERFCVMVYSNKACIRCLA